MTFCYHCRKEVSYTVKKESLRAVIKGETFLYQGHEVFCDCCHNTLIIEEIHDKNLSELRNVFRKQKGIISLELTQQLPSTYSISKKNLSKVLSWGVGTFPRFSQGEVPSRYYSDILLDISANPEHFLALLEKNQAEIPKKAFLKAKATTLSLMEKHKAI